MTNKNEDALLRPALGMRMVLLYGPSGSGKTWTARRLHDLRGRGEYVALNVGALPDDATMCRSELYGHVKGAFTSASGESWGHLGRIRGGTLFLDEFERLKPATANLLIDLLDTNPNARIYRVGASTSAPRPDFHVVISTKCSLAATAIPDDLRMRVVCSAYCIDLSERFEVELPQMIGQCADELGVRLDHGVMDHLCMSEWPGLNREVEGVLGVAARLVEKGAPVTIGLIDRIRVAQRRHLVAATTTTPAVVPAQAARRTRPSDAELLRLFEACGRNITHLARSLGRQRITVRRWLKDANGGPSCDPSGQLRT